MGAESSDREAAAALHGRRVRLRPLAEPDAAALWEAVAASRPALKRRFRWAAGAGGSEDAARFIRQPRGAVFAVEEARSGRLAGVASLRPPSAAGYKARMSLWIRADLQGRGYGTEAGRLLADHAFRRLGLHRLYARIDPANRASRKVLQKLGFRYEGCLHEDKRLNGRWVHQECWGLLKSEWKR